MSQPNLNYPATPTLDKVLAVLEKSQVIGEFLDWLQSQGVCLCKWEDVRPSGLSGYWPIHITSDVLLHKFFEIDPDQEEAERRAVLEYVRALSQRGVNLNAP